ncbi:hypothetical protein AOQ84DRAFT_355485 [Glonium stellatum]|uniref:Uncharacterized protein n=1 Tax=Glonium stellatum TaxID=574774 RepID=A0A8E2EX57_9PEZI|nr:hypothetical protein AOQ84DRAFT_355485 [Glonium stellatum]
MEFYLNARAFLIGFMPLAYLCAGLMALREIVEEGRRKRRRGGKYLGDGFIEM